MIRRKRRAALAAAAGVALIASMAMLPTTASADDHDSGKQPGVSKGPKGDLRNVGPDYNQGKAKKLDKSSFDASMRRQARSAAAAVDAAVGDTKTWLANDDTQGIYVKDYTLRGVGDHIQVWVADDRAFPDGDCRNDLGLADVTDAQVSNFVSEFDSNIYPKESKTFSVPPNRDGSKAPLTGILGLPDDYYTVDAAQSDDIVVLVDNVRDANFYTPSAPDGQTYIAGFFYSVFNEYVNRNVMTIDVFDWLHRTGATPPDDTANAAYLQCAQALGQTRPFGAPRPHLYEGTFAHEYQHLLEYYEDADEESWVNEGLSDWAQTLVGYVDPSIAPDQPGADGHLSCFQGFQPPNFGGPENSLTEWQDQGAPEILCDYGAAYSFMEYLSSHYGEKFMSALHKNDATGLVGLDQVLDQFGSRKSAQDTLHDWAAAMALDSAFKKRLTGGSAKDLSIRSMNAKINWANPQAYDTPGAPANGSDYVRLRDGAGNPIGARAIRSISFDGAETLAPTPVEWTVAATPPTGTTADTTCGSLGAGAAPAALYAGCGVNLDRSIVRSVAVPASGRLTFDALWDTEEGWDFGFAQVSDDGGKTWKSLSTADTTSEHDPGAVSAVTSQLPGLTGDSGTWKPQTADLSAYAGKNVLIGFRYVTDSGVNEGGFWVRNIKVGDTVLPSDSLDGWQTITQVNPPKVSGFTVQLVGYDGAGRAGYAKLRLNSAFQGSLDAKAVKRTFAKASVVAAIVTFDDPSEAETQQARYALKVNGVLQPGG